MKNNNENMFEKEFEIILSAGDSKTSSIEAIERARVFEFEEAWALIRKSETEMVAAHQFEKDLITEEANNSGKQYGVLMMHAQDHLMTAIIFLEMAQQMIKIYEELHELKGGIVSKN